MDKTVSGNKEYQRVLELLKGIASEDRLIFRFEGGCDDRSGPVLSIVHELHRLGKEVECYTGSCRFKYDPRYDAPHYPPDCYSLLGSDRKQTIHPQEVDEVVVCGGISERTD